MPSFGNYLDSFSPSWALGRLSSGFFGLVGVITDATAESYGQILRMPWLKEPTSPDDVLPLVGSERRMPRYPIETPAIYRERLWQAWEVYPWGGSRYSIEQQLEAAGFPGTVRYFSPLHPWSTFWVHFAIGTHNVTLQGPIINDPHEWSVGDGTIIGPEGITSGELFSLRELVKKWKHPQWVGATLVFQISGWTVGDGTVIGEPGLVIGGENAQVGVH
jgi:hypothetical protein